MRASILAFAYSEIEVDLLIDFAEELSFFFFLSFTAHDVGACLMKERMKA